MSNLELSLSPAELDELDDFLASPQREEIQEMLRGGWRIAYVAVNDYRAVESRAVNDSLASTEVGDYIRKQYC